MMPQIAKPVVSNKIHPSKKRCLDCGGFQIQGGSLFLPVAVPVNDKRTRTGAAFLGAICELCLLRRLDRRSKLVNYSSSKEWHITRELMSAISLRVEELSDIHREETNPSRLIENGS